MSTVISDEPRTAQPSVNHDTESLGGRLLRLSMLINLVMPLSLLLGVYVLRTLGVVPLEPLIPQSTLQLLFYVLLFVAVSELGVAFVLKRSILAPDKVRPTLNDAAAFARLVTTATIVLAALGAASLFYGVLLLLLGIGVASVAPFALIAFVHFRLFRPTAENLRTLILGSSAD